MTAEQKFAVVVLVITCLVIVGFLVFIFFQYRELIGKYWKGRK